MTYTADQLALQAHLIAEMEATKAKIDSGEYQFATWYTEDIDHWIEQGVNSIADLERYDLIAWISDTSKSAYGYRMRCDYDSMSMDELQKLSDQVSRDAGVQFEQEQEWEREAAVAFEKLIADTIEMGAGDRKTAIRWILEGEGLLEEMDMGYIEYSFGLRYHTYEDEFREVCNEVYPEVA